MPSTENKSYTAYQKVSPTNPSKQVTEVVPTEKFDAMNAELAEKGEELIVGVSQSFSIPSAETEEDIALLVPKSEGRVNAFNSGYSVQAANSARRLLKEAFAEDEKERFVAVQGHYDLQSKIAEDLANINKRLTPLEKVQKNISDLGLSAADLMKLVEMMNAAASQPAA